MSEAAWRRGRNWFPWLPPIFGYGQLQHPPPRPYDHEHVWIMRDEWEKPEVVRPRDLHPMMNAADLYWSPWDGKTIEHVPAPAFRPALSSLSGGGE